MKNRNGITLIALVVTIIVLLVLTGVVFMLVFGDEGIIARTEKTKFIYDISTFREELEMSISSETALTQGKRMESISILRNDYSDKSEFIVKMKEMIPSFSEYYADKLEIREDKLVYIGEVEAEEDWADDLKLGKVFSLKINYIDSNGQKLTDSHNEKKLSNKTYSIKSPVINDYTPKYDVIQGKITEDTEINVIYYKTSVNLAFSDTGKDTCMVRGIGSCKDKNLVIPEEYNGKKVTEINASAFKGNKNIETVVIPKSIQKVGEKSFTDCLNLKQIIIYSENLEGIGLENFIGCTKLEEYIVNSNNNNYTVIDGILFSKDLTKLIRYPQGKKDEEYTVPTTVTEVCIRGIDQNQYLQKLTITDSVKDVGDYAVALLPKLKSLTINLENINGTSAFCDNYYLTELVIGSNLKNMKNGKDVFRKAGRDSGTKITIKYDGTKAQWNSIVKATTWKDNSKIVAVECTDGKITF